MKLVILINLTTIGYLLFHACTEQRIEERRLKASKILDCQLLQSKGDVINNNLTYECHKLFEE